MSRDSAATRQIPARRSALRRTPPPTLTEAGNNDLNAIDPAVKPVKTPGTYPLKPQLPPRPSRVSRPPTPVVHRPPTPIVPRPNTPSSKITIPTPLPPSDSASPKPPSSSGSSGLRSSTSTPLPLPLPRPQNPYSNIEPPSFMIPKPTLPLPPGIPSSSSDDILPTAPTSPVQTCPHHLSTSSPSSLPYCTFSCRHSPPCTPCSTSVEAASAGYRAHLVHRERETKRKKRLEEIVIELARLESERKKLVDEKEKLEREEREEWYDKKRREVGDFWERKRREMEKGWEMRMRRDEAWWGERLREVEGRGGVGGGEVLDTRESGGSEEDVRHE